MKDLLIRRINNRKEQIVDAQKQVNEAIDQAIKDLIEEKSKDYYSLDTFEINMSSIRQKMLVVNIKSMQLDDAESLLSYFD